MRANTEPHAQLAYYTGWRGLPPLVGLSSMPDAARTGLTVEQSVGLLKRQHWMLRRLHDIFVFRLTSMPVYELKMAFSLHLHLAAEHIEAIRGRVREMREPPLGLDVSPDAALDGFFDEIKHAPGVEPLILGIYGKALPALVDCARSHLALTNRLFDHPTWRVVRLMLFELEEIAQWGAGAIDCAIDGETGARHADWLASLDARLAAAGGPDGRAEASGLPITPFYADKPHPFDPVPRRDERFQDLYNQGVDAEEFLHDPARPPLPKTLMLYFKRMREIDVPEMMASILCETPGKPWKYYRDMSRQLWDEARHAMMGELGFVASGLDWTEVPFTINWSLMLNTRLTPLERHAVLFFIEQGLMPNKNGKKAEWEIAVASTCRLSALMQDYDWADEILHAQIGREWLFGDFGSRDATMDAGDKAWTRAMSDWHRQKESGLTEHRNWWPDLYAKACRAWGIAPDPAIMAYDTSYEAKRADLETIA